MPFTSNQEDAMIVNYGYIARNGASSASYKTYVTKCDKNGDEMF